MQQRPYPQIAAGAIQVGAYGAFGGTTSMLTGGSFLSGALTGAAGSVVGSLTAGLHPALQVGSSAAFGGIVSKLSGGNFWNGAAQAGIIAGFNHAAHAVAEYEFFSRLRDHYEAQTGKDFILKNKEFKFLVKEALKNNVVDFKHSSKGSSGEYSAITNFYKTSADLALSFGRATLIYRTSARIQAIYGIF